MTTEIDHGLQLYTHILSVNPHFFGSDRKLKTDRRSISEIRAEHESRRAQSLEIHKRYIDSNPLAYSQMIMYFVDVYYVKKQQVIRDHIMIGLANMINHQNDVMRSVAQSACMAFLRWEDLYQVCMIVRRLCGGKGDIPSGKGRRLKKVVEFFSGITSELSLYRNKNKAKKMFRMTRAKGREIVRESLSLNSKRPTTTEPFPLFRSKEYIRQLTDEAAICEALDKVGVPGRFMFGLMPRKMKMTPAIASVILSHMTPDELVNFDGFRRKHGLDKIESFNKEIVDKQKKAKTIRVVAATQGTDVDAKTKMERKEVADAILKKYPKIKKGVTIVFDTSASQVVSIEIAKLIIPIVASISPDVEIFSFSSTTTKIPTPTEKTRTKYESVISLLRASGSTSLASPLMAIDPKDVVIFISDFEETAPPFLNKLDLGDMKKFSTKSLITITTPGQTDRVYTPTFTNLFIHHVGISINKADMTVVQQIITALSQGTPLDVLNEMAEIDIVGAEEKYKNIASNRRSL